MSLNKIKQDSDLVSLYHKKEWQSIITKLEKYESALNKKLMGELEEIYQKDQKYRREIGGIFDKYGRESNEFKKIKMKMEETDSLNIIRIEEIIEKYGYPGRSLVGKQMMVAFLVIQHAGLGVQKKYLPLLKEAADKGELDWSYVAILIDRVRVKNKKNRFMAHSFVKIKKTNLN